MPLPVQFAALTTPNLAQLDENFEAIGVLTPIHCTVSGSSSLTLTPVADNPSVPAYVDQMQFTGEAVSNNAGAVTAQVGSLAALAVFKGSTAGPIALTGNEFADGVSFSMMYLTSLNGGAGGFLLMNAQSASTSLSGQVQGTARRLAITVTSNTALTVLAEAICVSNGVAAYNTILAVNKTLGTGSTGLLGLDTGTVASSTWYAVYVIYNPTTELSSAVLSTSFTAPSQANTVGYTQYAYVGAVRTDGSSNLYRTRQYGSRAQYVVTTATNTTAMPQMVTTTGTVVFAVAVAVANFVPTSAATRIIGVARAGDSSGNQVLAAPNNNYVDDDTSYPPIRLRTNSNDGMNVEFDFILESADIYWGAIGNGGSPSEIRCLGWEDGKVVA